MRTLERPAKNIIQLSGGGGWIFYFLMGETKDCILKNLLEAGRLTERSPSGIHAYNTCKHIKK